MSITSETWWGRESTPPTLTALGAKLRAHYNLAAVAIGTKGDTNHLDGYHRSWNWDRNSAYCTNRNYSTTETAGNRSPANRDWVCAMDVTLPHDELLAACQRLDKAVRAGRLEKVTEWYGNDDGDQRVDGYDNIRNVVASSDSSHLWHLHMSFDRARVAESHDDVFAILTGEDDVSELFPVYGDKGEGVKRVQYQLDALGYYGGAKDGVYGDVLAAAVKKFRAAHKVDVVGDGKTVTGWMTTAIDADLRAKDAKPGPAGPPGPAGEPGPAGTLPPGSVLSLDATTATVTAVTLP
jgi:hypothetical protein